jgi:oligopeptide/dipeptide ABC transporter ATP-binding protein
MPASESKYKENPASDHILSVKDLKTYFYTDDGVVKAVDGVTLTVKRGEMIGLVGESGCGKSVTSFSIIRLVLPPGKILSGEILFNGRNLLELNEDEMDKIRGNRISMVFQQPTTCLNPVMKIGDHIAEIYKIHQKMDKKEALQKAVQMLETVGIPEPEKRLQAYPHEVSGGQAQRVMIAMALACNPELLIADEPTTALDVTIQAQILDLLRSLQSESGTSIILITHDLGVIAEMAERVLVMYAGQIVEEAPVKDLFAHPLHPYTLGLLKSIPVAGRKQTRLDVIPGSVPDLLNIPSGCRFEARCQACQGSIRELCKDVMPELKEVEPGHWVRCHLY